MAEKMRAVGYRKPLPISDPASLEDLEVPVPEPGPRDLLVRVEAVSVNPVDVKIRASADPGGEPKILGYDAAGVVVATGPDVTLFSPGDEVYYAGHHRPARHGRAVPPGRRAHRRAQAPQPGLRPGRRAAADHHHRVGIAVRPVPAEPGEFRRAAGAGGRGRGRIDGHPAGPGADPDGHHRHRVPARVAAVGPRPRRAPRDRPPQPGPGRARHQPGRGDAHLLRAHGRLDRGLRRDPAAVRRDRGHRRSAGPGHRIR